MSGERLSQSCCPGGPVDGHRGWCASTEAEAVRIVGASEPATETAQIVPVRCYTCGHRFGAVPSRIDTTCTECGSDSFVQIKADSEATS